MVEHGSATSRPRETWVAFGKSHRNGEESPRKTPDFGCFFSVDRHSGMKPSSKKNHFDSCCFFPSWLPSLASATCTCIATRYLHHAQLILAPQSCDDYNVGNCHFLTLGCFCHELYSSANSSPSQLHVAHFGAQRNALQSGV